MKSSALWTGLATGVITALVVGCAPKDSQSSEEAKNGNAQVVAHENKKTAASAPVVENLTDEQSRGRIVFDRWCAPCHGVGVRSHPGTGALAVKYQGSIPAALEERVDLSPEFIGHFVRNGVSVMPFFRVTEITPEGMHDLSAYLVRNNGKKSGETL